MLKDLNVSIQQGKAEQMNQRKLAESEITQLLDEGAQTFSQALVGVGSLNSIKRESSSESHLSVSSASTTATSASSPMSPTKSSREDTEGDANASSRLPLVKMEGYMLKRSSGAIKSWSRRYFILNLQECRLDYLSPKDSDTPIVAVFLTGAKITEIDIDDRRYVLYISSQDM